jgi:hypothetical protein
MPQNLAAVHVNFGQGFQNLINTVAHAIPKILVFLLILIVGYIVARVLMKIIEAVLERLHFDRFAERGMVGQALSRGHYTASRLVAKIAYYAVLLIVLQMGFGVFGPNPISSLLNGIVAWLPKAAVAIILVVVASAIAKVVKDLVGTALAGLSYGRFVASAASVLILALGVIAALNQVGIATAVTTPFLIAVLGTAGLILAIGVGGGLIRPMQDRWERILGAAERETSTHLAAAYEQGRRDSASMPPGTAARPSAEEAERIAATAGPGQQARQGQQGQQGQQTQQGGGSGPSGPQGYRPGPNSNLGGGQTGPGGRQI